MVHLCLFVHHATINISLIGYVLTQSVSTDDSYDKATTDTVHHISHLHLSIVFFIPEYTILLSRFPVFASRERAFGYKCHGLWHCLDWHRAMTTCCPGKWPNVFNQPSTPNIVGSDACLLNKIKLEGSCPSILMQLGTLGARFAVDHCLNDVDLSMSKQAGKQTNIQFGSSQFFSLFCFSRRQAVVSCVAYLSFMHSFTGLTYPSPRCQLDLVGHSLPAGWLTDLHILLWLVSVWKHLNYP